MGKIESRILEGSAAISMALEFARRYRRFEDRVSVIHSDSLTHGFAERTAERLKKYFHFSVINRIADCYAKENREMAIVDESGVVRYIAFIARMSHKSIAVFTVEAMKDAFTSSLFKGLGIIITVSLLVNISLTIALGRSMDLFGWGIKCAFLFAGFAVLFSDADWRTTKETSVFIGMVKRKNHREKRSS
ncbi:MAG: hypothetical protein Q7S07_00140 [Candidatus Omnitrophota bacterium]|nr:hypothetical protein [Candidatus Omnitrophota bacterium]